ncbi:hypothetical protein E1A91_A05G192900v1 [Gossypium mustelinum]|uniref:DUF241 domain-containing protein n=4 Tax=Gossypium TaxID=3633 RepID=A0A2P5WSZ8_GOSBA|nr:hypothetical protein ES319_A05G188300v1 [Gossypium barbadense]PPR94204.1 hypothetical protein GOBAR_AA26462 [Gossypium barbadense]TYH17445.1 hypothetical protein ES288_A05G191900v1 [Gossypium darwinii]TYI27715.1 hypothetical protein ES332_A05G195400v1 [Gossypium tomentosum]TYJ34788.1 hypothetical protein E1A91_A05G192900v1 [Gossypium mustelinum]
MVGVFRRSLSFPNKTLTRPPKPQISHHIRSISLPCRSHPLITQIKDEITDLKTWSRSPEKPTSAWLCDGLLRLKDLQDSLHDILQLPQTQQLLSHKREWVEKLLEDFLRFVDVYGIFQTSFLSLKEEQLAARVALRRKDDSRIAVYLKGRKKMAKEIAKLVSSIRCIGRYSFPASAFVSILDTELTGVISDIIEVTVSVSVALFNGISMAFTSSKSSWIRLALTKKSKKVKIEGSIKEFEEMGEANVWSLRRKGDEEVRMVLERMQNLERCIADIESGSDKAFRSLINTRVSLLNTLTM